MPRCRSSRRRRTGPHPSPTAGLAARRSARRQDRGGVVVRGGEHRQHVTASVRARLVARRAGAARGTVDEQCCEPGLLVRAPGTGRASTTTGCGGVRLVAQPSMLSAAALRTLASSRPVSATASAACAVAYAFEPTSGSPSTRRAACRRTRRSRGPRAARCRRGRGCPGRGSPAAGRRSAQQRAVRRRAGGR
jgi:hypothetical protein